MLAEDVHLPLSLYYAAMTIVYENALVSVPVDSVVTVALRKPRVNRQCVSLMVTFDSFVEWSEDCVFWTRHLHGEYAISALSLMIGRRHVDMAFVRRAILAFYL